MSQFFSANLNGLAPYIPGEQPRDKRYIKLNTNESPYPPSPKAVAAAAEAAKSVNLYSDPDQRALKTAVAEFYGISADMVSCGNGSDENLAHIFRAFCDEGRGMACPNVSYGFYPVLCAMLGIRYSPIPLKADFTINIADYAAINDNVCIANPNAQTGIYLPLSEVEKLVAQNADRVVIVDEAYIDFGGSSAVRLINKYKNLIVVQTMSKSRALAGARVGFCFACAELIAEIEAVRNSFNPYNLNSMSIAAATQSIQDSEYFKNCVQKVISARQSLVQGLKTLKFEVLPSLANFVLAKSDKISGEELYLKLKERGILVRHFNDELIKEYIRITVGTVEQVNSLLKAIESIIGD